MATHPDPPTLDMARAIRDLLLNSDLCDIDQHLALDLARVFIDSPPPPRPPVWPRALDVHAIADEVSKLLVGRLRAAGVRFPPPPAPPADRDPLACR